MCEYCRRQAKSMAGFAGIDLRPKQEETYIVIRHIMPSGKKGEESPPSCGQTDQEVLYQSLAVLIEEQEAVLIEEQQAALIRVFPFLLVRKN